MNRLYLTFEGQHVGESGLPVDAFAHALTGMQDAMRLMVEHLGGRQPGPGQPPRWVREQSNLQLTTVRPGSLVVELTVAAPDRQLPLENYAEQAVKAIYGWDGSQDSTLPPAVTDRLCDIPSALPADVRVARQRRHPPQNRNQALQRCRPTQYRKAKRPSCTPGFGR